MISKSQNLVKYLVYVVVFLLPFYIFRYKIGPFRTNLFEISIFITFAIFIIERVFSRQIKKMQFGGLIPLIFMLIALISIIQSNSLVTGLGIFKGWFLAPFMLYLMIINLFHKDSLSKLSIPLFCSLIFVSFWAYLQKGGIIATLFYQSGDASFVQYLAQNRFYGPFESPNFLAMFIAPVFFLSLPLFRSPSFGLSGHDESWAAEEKESALLHLSTLKRGLLYFSVGILFLLPIYALYLTGSRGGLIAFGASSLVFVVLMFLPAIKKYTFALSVIKIVGLVAVNIVYFYYFIQVKFPEAAASDKIRQEIYEYSIKLLKTDWLFGIGLGNFQAKVQALSTVDYSFINFGLPYALHPHNLLLAVWLNLGLAGIIVFLFIVGSFLKQIITSAPSITRASAGAAMTAILVHGLFDTTYFKNDLSAIFWLVLAGSFFTLNNKIKGSN